MNWKELKALSEHYVIPPVSRLPLDLDRGEGATLYDLSGNMYTDFAGGINGNSLGAGYAPWAESVMEQIFRLGAAPANVYTGPEAELGFDLCTRTGMAKALFTCSGSLGNEAMVHMVRQYSQDHYGPGRGVVLTLNNATHGGSLEMLAASGSPALGCHPLRDGYRRIEADMDAIRAAGDKDVCAVLLELVQIGGSLEPLPRSFIHALAVFCAEQDWLLLVDEVQTGAGRCGSLFAFQQYGILPDAVSFGSSLAGGLPFGGLLVSNRCRELLPQGGSGGHPVSCAGARALLDFLNENTLAGIREKGDYLRSGIETLHLSAFGPHRGLGLLVGLPLLGNRDAVSIAEQLSLQGLLCLPAQDGLLLAPPLTVTKEELDRGLLILSSVLLEGA
ncbi:MAG: Acetylornithine aminotransferase [Firmicutes bacterium]|nr:Acetylornithine aminotransferase [Bacillota bacterium]